MLRYVSAMGVTLSVAAGLAFGSASTNMAALCTDFNERQRLAINQMEQRFSSKSLSPSAFYHWKALLSFDANNRLQRSLKFPTKNDWDQDFVLVQSWTHRTPIAIVRSFPELNRLYVVLFKEMNCPYSACHIERFKHV